MLDMDGALPMGGIPAFRFCNSVLFAVRCQPFAISNCIEIQLGASKKPADKARRSEKSGVYIPVNEHFRARRNAVFGIFRGAQLSKTDPKEMEYADKTDHEETDAFVADRPRHRPFE
jgi:hypothetical protein